MLKHFVTYDFWTIFTYKSACYGVNLHCMHSITVINSEVNKQFLTLRTEWQYIRKDFSFISQCKSEITHFLRYLVVIFEYCKESVIVRPFEVNDCQRQRGSALCLFCKCYRIRSYSPQREDMGQINLHAPLDFLGFVPAGGYTNSSGRPKRQQITLTLKCVEASELFDISNNSANLFQELKEPKPLSNTMFL